MSGRNRKNFNVAWLFGLIVLLGLLPIAATVKAEREKSEELKERGTVILQRGEVVNRDYFAAGRRVQISGTVNGDVYAAGGEVIVDGRVNGDLLAAGGSVLVSGDVEQDARVAGGQVTVSGKVGRNVSLAGGDVALTQSARIHGGVAAAAGHISLGAPVGGDVKVAGTKIEVSNSIGGNLDVAAREVILSSEAVVAGDFTCWSNQAPLIDRNARVAGRVSQTIARGVWARKVLGPALALLWLARIMSLISTLVIGLVILLIFPGYSHRVVSALRERTWASLGVGVIASIAIPLASFVLFLTVLGVPLALLLLGVSAMSLYVGRVFVLACMGLTLFGRWGKKPHEGWAYAGGVLLYFVLTLIPVIGGLFTFFVSVSGLGGAILAGREMHRAA